MENLGRKGDRLYLFLVGSTFFFAGLFKKVILADNIGAYADPVFNDAAEGCDEPLALLKKIISGN